MPSPNGCISSAKDADTAVELRSPLPARCGPGRLFLPKAGPISCVLPPQFVWPGASVGLVPDPRKGLLASEHRHHVEDRRRDCSAGQRRPQRLSELAELQAERLCAITDGRLERRRRPFGDIFEAGQYLAEA